MPQFVLVPLNQRILELQHAPVVGRMLIPRPVLSKAEDSEGEIWMSA